MALLMSPDIEERWIAHKSELESAVRGTIQDSELQINVYSTNAGNLQSSPVAVLTPENEEDVKEAIGFCSKYGIPLTARGAGTSTVDAAIGKGLVVDFSRNMKSILAVDVHNNLVRVQAGVTIEMLNIELEKLGKMLPLFPAKGLSCTVGGCISVDAGGFLASRWGRMHDMIAGVRFISGRGEALELTGDYINSLKELSSLRERHQCTTWTQMRGTCVVRPDALQKEGGYLELIAGSEGELGLITEAVLHICDIPSDLTVFLAPFKNAEDAISAAKKLSLKCWCIEYLDPLLTSSVATDFKVSCSQPSHSLAIICSETDVGELEGLEDKRKLETDMQTFLRYLADVLHKLQRPVNGEQYVISGEGFYTGKDASDVITRINTTARRLGLKCMIFGHASEGIMYARPKINITREEGRRKLESFTAEVLQIVSDSGGAIAAENGIGGQLARYVGEFAKNEFELFMEIKQIFDPLQILRTGRSEGKDAKYRFESIERSTRFRPKLSWEDGDMLPLYNANTLSPAEEMIACNGCGECRTTSFIETQCPVYRTVGGEIASPRGLNSLIRTLAYHGIMTTMSHYGEEYGRVIFSYCIQCKMCVAECPTHVNTPKLIMEGRAEFVSRRGSSAVKRAASFFSDYEFYTMVGSSMVRLSNRLIKSERARAFLERYLGVDRRKLLPEFDELPFREWYNAHEPVHGELGDVIYFSDAYASYFDSRIGRATVLLLEMAGYTVLYPRQKFTGQQLIHMGLMREAKKYLLENVSYLYSPAIRGMRIICSSPSAAMALKFDYLSHTRDERSLAVSQAASDIYSFLARSDREIEFGRGGAPSRVYYFPSCHARALKIDGSVAELLRKCNVDELAVARGTCCGAGTGYSYGKENFALSMDIGKKAFREIADAKSRGYHIVTDGEDCALQIEQGTGARPEIAVLMLARSAGMKV